ncbi:hypothetical protein R3P38DRAFT_3329602 [Favolaschia claudopus]|uniref:Uncharacterized protein n=1 Tax=Favolaschia claudopus TaxID=2862362 RepID=A0AAW0A010_9AGAR
MRNHVGHHILFAMRNKHDPKLSPDTIQITSNCSYHYAKMMYKAAKTSTEASPCTNVPLQCPLCPISKSGNRKTIWKYNAVFHLISEHSTSGKTPPKVPPQFWIETHIRHAEEQALGITDDETSRFRTEYTIPNSDAVDGWDPEKKGRERSDTQSTSHSVAHKHKQIKLSQ